MPLKNVLIVASKIDQAGINITTQLSQLKESKFNFYLCEKEIIYTENLDLEKINQYDFVIFASKHKSEQNRKTLSVHSIGNWRDAQFGGERGKISPSSAQFLKYIFKELRKQAGISGIDKQYEVTLEATHHGPLINKPSLFIEIGSTENEWTDSRAAFVVAKTIRNSIESFSPLKYREVAIGVGGGHYCPNFNQIQLKTNVAISHIIPGYSLPLSEEMIIEAIEKTQEEDVDFFLLDIKGINNDDIKNQVIEILEGKRINYESVSDILKR
jgi:D-aminoacyl-tRNA deacylase